MKRYIALTWQTHPGHSANPPRIAREEFEWGRVGFKDLANKMRWLKENSIAYTVSKLKEA